LRQVAFPYEALCLWIWRLFASEGEVVLAMDRTSWQLGRSIINILMLSICHQGIAIPLMWQVLGKRHYLGGKQLPQKKDWPILISENSENKILPVCSMEGLTKNDVFYAVVQPQNLDNFQKTTGNKLVDGEIDYNSNPYIITFTLDENTSD